MSLLEEAQLNNPNGIVDMFDLDYTTRLSTSGTGPNNRRFTGEQGSITFDSNVYQSTSVIFNSPTVEMGGKIPQTSIIIYGQFTDLLSDINGYNSLIEGSTLSFITTHLKFLDGGTTPDPTQFLLETYTVDSIREKSKERIEILLTIGLGVERINQPGLRTIV